MPDDIEDIKEKTHISMNTNFNEDFKILIKNILGRTVLSKLI